MSEKTILVAASSNKNKLKEIEAILGSQFEIRPMAAMGVTEDIEETGTTFEENALIKAEYVMRKTGCAAIADDSGLEVDALQGDPGVYSARYCGRHGDDEANNQLLLQNLRGMDHPWTARYVAAIALVRPGKAPILRRGTCEGEIIDHYEGTGGFGYDPLFRCELGKTFAEINMEEKNKISHRKRGIEAVMAELLEEQNG